YNYNNSCVDLKCYDDDDAIEYKYMYTSVAKDVSFEVEYPITRDCIPGGTFVCISFVGSSKEDNYMAYYNQLKQYIKDNNIKTDDTVYQLSLQTSYSYLKDETFLTELRLRITQ